MMLLIMELCHKQSLDTLREYGTGALSVSQLGAPSSNKTYWGVVMSPRIDVPCSVSVEIQKI